MLRNVLVWSRKWGLIKNEVSSPYAKNTDLMSKWDFYSGNNIQIKSNYNDVYVKRNGKFSIKK